MSEKIRPNLDFCSLFNLGFELVLDLSGQPLDALVQALAGDRVAGADVPRLVHDPLQAQGLRHLHTGQGVSHVHLVGEEQDWDFSGRSTSSDHYDWLEELRCLEGSRAWARKPRPKSLVCIV